MTSQQRAAAYFAARFLGIPPHEWDALPPEIQQVYLTQPIRDEDR